MADTVSAIITAALASIIYDYTYSITFVVSCGRGRAAAAGAGAAALPAPGGRPDWQPRSAARPIVARMLPCRLATALLAAAAVSHGRDAPQRPHLVHVVVDE